MLGAGHLLFGTGHPFGAYQVPADLIDKLDCPPSHRDMASFDQAGLEIYSDWFLIAAPRLPLNLTNCPVCCFSLRRGDRAAIALRHPGESPEREGSFGRIDAHLYPARVGSLAQRRAGARGNRIRQHSIDGERAVLLTLEGRSNKKAAPCGGTAPGGYGAVLRPTGSL